MESGFIQKMTFAKNLHQKNSHHTDNQYNTSKNSIPFSNNLRK